MRITTWNVNSIRARAHRVAEVVERDKPDVLCLQELKCQDHQFPHELFEDLGYSCETFGQKTYNGVAICSRLPMSGVSRDFPIPGDGQSRGIAAMVGGVRVVNLYVVNGKQVGHDYYDYKLRWLDALQAWVEGDATPDDDVVICGDFNIAPADGDVWDPARWEGENLCSPPERERFQRLLAWGFTDAFRVFHDEVGRYAHTWWDFRGNGFGRGRGLRIDHHLITESVKARANGCYVDRSARKGIKPSDHAPVTLVLDEPDFDPKTLRI